MITGEGEGERRRGGVRRSGVRTSGVRLSGRLGGSGGMSLGHGVIHVPVVSRPAMVRRTSMWSGGARHGGPRDPAQPIGHVLVTGGRRGSSRVRGLHLGVDLGAVHLDAARRLDPESDRVTANVQHDNAHVVADNDAFP
jgi:hypothetical protein